jgi:hypothetical protein
MTRVTVCGAQRKTSPPPARCVSAVGCQEADSSQEPVRSSQQRVHPRPGGLMERVGAFCKLEPRFRAARRTCLFGCGGSSLTGKSQLSLGGSRYRQWSVHRLAHLPVGKSVIRATAVRCQPINRAVEIQAPVVGASIPAICCQYGRSQFQLLAKGLFDSHLLGRKGARKGRRGMSTPH